MKAKTYELVEFDLKSIARISFLIYFVFGLIISIGVGVYAVYIGELTVMESIVVMIFDALLIAAACCAFCVLIFWLYNYFVKQVGGIKVKLK